MKGGAGEHACTTLQKDIDHGAFAVAYEGL